MDERSVGRPGPARQDPAPIQLADRRRLNRFDLAQSGQPEQLGPPKRRGLVEPELHAVAALDRRHRAVLISPQERHKEAVAGGDHRHLRNEKPDHSRGDRQHGQRPQAVEHHRARLELGVVAPAGEDWFAVFEFDDVGYVKDDEKDSLDANALLDSIKKGTEAGNQERLKRGWPTMTILGWETPPRYNEITHNLEWAIRAQSDGEPVVNHNTRLLGRGGVMEVTLVTNPATLAETLPKFKTMLEGFEFKQGRRYAEFRAGDRTAAYGLTGLIVGGGTAALVKTGAFKWIWKLLVAGAAGVAALAKKLFSRNRTA